LPRRARRLVLESLEARDVPATYFKIDSFTPNNAQVIDHSGVTGPDQGGIAVSSSQVFVTGAFSSGRFNRTNLSGGTSIAKLDALVADLHTEAVYVLGTNATTPLGTGGGTVTHLLAVNGATGALTGASIALSSSIAVGANTGLFSGYDRVVLHPQNGNVFEIALPSGTVTNLGALTTTDFNMNGGWAYWGTAESFGGQTYLDYVQAPLPPSLSATTIVRQRVSDGQVTPLATFADLGAMADFTAAPAIGRWYFHHPGQSQFTGPALMFEVTGFADATFVLPDFVVTNTLDSGPGSLRQAIANANAAPGTQIIVFDFPAVSGTINLASPIPVTQSVIIEGPGSGNIRVAGTGSNTLFAASGGASLTIEQITLSNPSGLTVPYPLFTNGDVVLTAGSADVTFTGNLNVFSSLTVIDGNAVELGPTTTLATGSLTAPTGVTVGPAETLVGQGSVNGPVTIQNGGFLDPVGSIKTGDLTVANGGQMKFAINGPFDHDSLTVNGTVNIGTGTNFSATLNYPPSLADSFVLISNNLTDSATGVLNGARNRSGLNIGSTLFHVRYDGGTGNDIELLVNDAPTLNTDAATTLTPILEDVPPSQNPGTTIAALIATDGLYSDPEGLFRSGIAVVGQSGGTGAWQFSRDGGTSWTAIPAVSPTSALLLEADAAGLNRIRFLPNADFFGTATLSFKGWDAADGRPDGATGVNVSSGGANAAVSAATESAVIEVLAVNDVPVAKNDAYSLSEDDSVPISPGVLANDSDVDGPLPLTASLVTAPVHGTVNFQANGDFSYTPHPNYFGPDQFTYKVADGHGASSIGTAFLTINPINDPPTAKNDTATTTEDGGAVSIDVLANDSFAPDAGESLTITAKTDPTHGTVAIAADQMSLLYTPAAHYNGPDSFTYTISDGNGGTATATVNVTVESVNDPPDAVGDVLPGTEDAGAQTLDLLANDTFAPDAGESLVIGSVTQATNGTVAIAADGLSVTYTPNTDFAGQDTFFYTVSDGNGGSDFAAVTVNVANDAADRLEVVTSTGTTEFKEGIGPVLVDGGLNGVRVGAGLEGVLTKATVKFANGFVKAKDKLQFTPIPGIKIKGTYSALTGTLTLTGTASPADYQAALRTVVYNNTSPAPVNGVRTLQFRVQDAAGVGDPATKLVRVTGVNTKPTLTLPLTAVNYRRGRAGIAFASTLGIKDVDNTRLQGAEVRITGGFVPGQDVLTYVLKPGVQTLGFNPTTGVLTFTGNATLATYLAVLRSVKFLTPVGAAPGNRTVSITVHDGHETSDAVTRSVNVI
jgi:hypothetical protein